MSTSDTKEITTPNGHKVVIRAYTTHGDDKQARAILNKGMHATATTDGDPVVNFDGGAIEESEAKYVELLVQSVDGDSSNVPDALDGLRTEDYNAVAAAVKEITASDPKASKN